MAEAVHQNEGKACLCRRCSMLEGSVVQDAFAGVNWSPLLGSGAAQPAVGLPGTVSRAWELRDSLGMCGSAFSLIHLDLPKVCAPEALFAAHGLGWKKNSKESGRRAPVVTLQTLPEDFALGTSGDAGN